MASTYSTNLAIELIGTGEQSGTWGTTTNTNLGTLLEQAISGYVTQPITDGSGANTTITIPNGTTGVARNMFIEMTGALSFATTSLIVPANKKLYFIFNNTSGGFAVTVKVSGQTGILVPNGKKVVLVSNGTDIVEAHTAIVGNATVGGTLGVGGALSVTASAASQFRNDQNTETYIFIRNDSAGTAATARLDLITGTGADRALTLVNYGSGYTGTFAGVALANLRVIYDNAAGAASNGIMIASPKTIYIAPNNSVVGTFAAAGLTVTGTLGAGATSVTTLAASGVVSTTARSMLVQPTTATNDGSYKVTNSGGTLFVGLDDSAAGAFGTAGNYGTVIYRPNGTGLAISRTSTVDLAISSAGVVNIPGGLNNTVLGATTPAAASVTTLAASGNITATTGAGTFGSLVLANSGSELWRAGASAASRAWSLRNDVSAFGDFLLQHSSTNNDTINTTLVSFSTGAVAVTGTLGVTGTISATGSGANVEITRAAAVGQHFQIGDGTRTARLAIAADNSCYVGTTTAHNFFVTYNGAINTTFNSVGQSIAGTLTTSGKATVNAALDVNPAFGLGVYVSPATDANGTASVLRLYGGANQFTNRYVEISCYNNGGSNVNELVFKVGNVGTIFEAMHINYVGDVTMGRYGVGTATFNSAGTISSVSDETWKTKDGIPTDPDLMLKKLEPGYWYYNDEKKKTFGKERQLGFYAQNVNAAIGPEAAPEPETVTTKNEDGTETSFTKPWGYYDRSVLAVVVMSLQKALLAVEQLTAKVAALETK